MTHLLTALPCLLGFALLLTAMARHQQDCLKRKLPARASRLLRATGLALLTIGFIIAGLGLGWAYGSVSWFGWLSVGAVLTLTVQTNRERILARLRR
ncbi:DUF3325 domain-containing protein [Novosphingobium rosa]|uniref:DUF3325 domain-containing protein n=1 Tax=Novosphingobium rosa TaxID=76978 RepID=UPI0008295C08|nr:DUF3325 domain-containing protein [Novosphingobium rosa]